MATNSNTENGNRTPKKRQVYAIATAIVIIAALVFGVFIQQMYITVQDDVVANMNELSRHDVNHIQTYMTSKVDALSHSGKNMQAYKARDMQQAQEMLKLESDGSVFEHMYLIDSEGRSYSDAFTTRPPDENPFNKYFEAGGRYFITTEWNSSANTGRRTNYIVYGLTIEPCVIGDVTIVGIVGTNPINLLQSKLSVDNYNGMGFSSLIDDHGNYVVNSENAATVKDDTNFYATLERGRLTDITLEQVEDAINKEEPILFTWHDEEGTEMVTSISPLDKNDWSFIMTVPRSAFTEQSMRLVTMTSVMLVIILVLVIVLFFINGRISKRRVAREASIKARSEFLSSLSHEIRTPITGLVGLNDLMRRNVGNPEKMEDLINQQGKSTEYLLSLVNDILDMSKIEAGKIDYVLAPVNIQDLLETSCALQAEVYAQRGVNLEANLDLPEPWILTDALHAQQVVMNVLGNASKFTPRGGNVTITATQRKDGGAPAGERRVITTIKIADTGIGMTPEFLETIWDPFAQERSGYSSGQKGTGLGMSISHDLIVGLGGDISVESQLGAGSTFTIDLPAQVAEPIEVPDEGQIVIPENIPALSELSVLVAEDNDLNAAILVEGLKAEGVKKVERSRNGAEVVSNFSKSALGEYDVILMDANMPALNGFEATTRIRSLDRDDSDVIILLTSANSVDESATAARDASMNGCLPKPVSLDLVAEAVGAINAARKAGKDAFYVPPQNAS